MTSHSLKQQDKNGLNTQHNNQAKFDLLNQIIEKINAFLVNLEAYHSEYPIYHTRLYRTRLKILKSGLKNISTQVKFDPIQTTAQILIFNDILKFIDENLRNKGNIPSVNSIPTDIPLYGVLMEQLSSLRAILKEAQPHFMLVEPEQLKCHFSINFVAKN